MKTRMKRLHFATKLLMLVSVIFIVPMLLMIFYGIEDTDHVGDFLIPTVGSLLLAAVAEFLQRRKKDQRYTNRQQGVVIVVTLWLVVFFLGALPFYFSGRLDFLRSVFESVSGWTATGFTMLDVAITPRIFLFYRAMMQFFGGLGFVLLMLLFTGGSEAMNLFTAEGHTDKLEGNLIDTSRIMMGIYVGFTALGVILYVAFGMPVFDAFCHAMSAMATGGFSTQSLNIAAYNSLPIEIVTIILMLVGGTNFAILALLVRGRVRKFLQVGETRFAAVIGLLAVALLAIAGRRVYPDLGENLRISFFQVATGLSTTGYSLSDFSNWNSAMRMVLVVLMIIGGGLGSTAGGMKYTRVYLLYKSQFTMLRSKFLPEHAMNPVVINRPQGKTTVSKERILEVHQFAILYLLTFFGGSFLLMLAGVPMEQAMFDFSSALSTTGISCGITHAGARNFVLLVQIFGMIMARLEVYIVAIFVASGISRASHVKQSLEQKLVDRFRRNG